MCGCCEILFVVVMIGLIEVQCDVVFNVVLIIFVVMVLNMSVVVNFVM